MAQQHRTTQAGSVLGTALSAGFFGKINSSEAVGKNYRLAQTIVVGTRFKLITFSTSGFLQELCFDAGFYSCDIYLIQNNFMAIYI